MTTRVGAFIMNLPQGSIRMAGNHSVALLVGMGEGFDQGLLALSNDTNDDIPRYEILDSYYDIEPDVEGLGDYDITMELTEEQSTDRRYLSHTYTGHYILILKDHLDVISVFKFATELELRQFLQGLITMLNAFNVDPRTIIIYAPFRNNDDYSIGGMTLLKLE